MDEGWSKLGLMKKKHLQPPDFQHLFIRLGAHQIVNLIQKNCKHPAIRRHQKSAQGAQLLTTQIPYASS